MMLLPSLRPKRFRDLAIQGDPGRPFRGLREKPRPGGQKSHPHQLLLQLLILECRMSEVVLQAMRSLKALGHKKTIVKLRLGG